MNNPTIGTKVTRIGSSKDYTTGRRGEIVELNGDRVRVRWTHERNGSPVYYAGNKPGNGVRTWVNKKFLIETSLVSESSSDDI